MTSCDLYIVHPNKPVFKRHILHLNLKNTRCRGFRVWCWCREWLSPAIALEMWLWTSSSSLTQEYAGNAYSWASLPICWIGQSRWGQRSFWRNLLGDYHIHSNSKTPGLEYEWTGGRHSVCYSHPGQRHWRISISGLRSCNRMGMKTQMENHFWKSPCVSSFPWLWVNLKQEGSSRRTVLETSVVLPLCSVAELCIRWEHKAERAVHLAAGKQKQSQ